MRIATLFSGIGSPEQGAKRVYENFETVFACEWDKFARQSYMANYDISEDRFYKDVHDLDARQYKGQVDILIGGSPCQAFSLAGMRHGTDDERGKLIYQYIRVVDECKPEIIIYENVKGIMSIDNGNTVKDFVQALRDIGYYCHYGVVNTKDYGVPQNRERLYLVGFLDSELYHKFHFADKKILTMRLIDVLEDDVEDKYYLSDVALKGYKTHAQRMQERGNGFKFEPTDGNVVASSVTTRAGGRPDDNFIKVVGHSGTGGERGDIISPSGISSCLTATDYKQPKHIKVPSATKCGYETAVEGDSINLSVPSSKTRRGRVGKQVSQCLDTSCNQAVVEPNMPSENNPMIYDDYNGNLKKDGLACTLTVNCGASAPRNGQKVITNRI